MAKPPRLLFVPSALVLRERAHALAVERAELARTLHDAEVAEVMSELTEDYFPGLMMVSE